MNNNKRLFAKNSITGVVQKILIAILTFVTIPIFIKLLGAELFGIFAIVSTIGDLSRLTNVGFHIALIKFLSRQGKTTESSQDVVVAFLSMLVIMTLLVIVLLLFSDFILLQLFNVGRNILPPANSCFIAWSLPMPFCLLACLSVLPWSHSGLYTRSVLCSLSTV